MKNLLKLQLTSLKGTLHSSSGQKQIGKNIMQPLQIPISQEFSKRIVTAKNWNEYEEMVHKVISTGMYALIGTTPIGYYVSEEEHKDWYRSSETVPEDHPYLGHLSNKKWPLKKVL